MGEALIMGKIVKFRKRPKSKLPKEWQGYRAKRPGASGLGYAITGLVLGGLVAVAIITAPGSSVQPAAMALGLLSKAEPATARTFTHCHTGGGSNCVVDGDTIWMDGIKIRVADIDAPETHPPRTPKRKQASSDSPRANQNSPSSPAGD